MANLDHFKYDPESRTWCVDVPEEIEEKQLTHFCDFADFGFSDKKNTEYIDKLASLKEENSTLTISLKPKSNWNDEYWMDSAPSGSSGYDGSEGGDGGDGSNGTCGRDGIPGEDGNNAPFIYIKVEGTIKELVMHMGLYPNDKNTKRISLNNPVRIHIDGRGGDGQNGQPGQDGGQGGNGGRGGNGLQVISGPGKKGGNGGNGGQGGHGGNGGDGGSGGNGARVIIDYEDARLLTLFTFDMRGGLGGPGGNGGRPGRGGRGGVGGEGGIGFDPTNKESATPAPCGRPGLSGADGFPGKSGMPGEGGKIGAVFFRNISEKQEQGFYMFNAKVLNYQISGLKHDDGILEPGEHIKISNIEIQNDGSLTVPKNAVVTVSGSNELFELTDSADFMISSEIPPGSQITLRDIVIKGRILPPPHDCPKITYEGKSIDFNVETIVHNSKSFLYRIEYTTTGERIEKYCRYGGHISLESCIRFPETSFHFVDSKLTKRNIVQYPVRLERLSCPPSLIPGGECKLTFDIANISNMEYGGKNGNIAYRVDLHKYHTIIGENSNSKIEGVVQRLAPNSSVTISIPIQINLSNKDGFFNQTEWSVTLKYSDVDIEESSTRIRICPEFDSDYQTSDVLLITNKDFSSSQYMAYEGIFTALGLRFSVYDESLYRSQPDIHWLGKFRRKLIVYPLGSEEQLSDIDGKAIVDHITACCDDQTDTLESGFVLIGGNPLDILQKKLYDHSTSEDILDENTFSDTFTFSEPTRQYMEECCQRIQKEYEGLHPSHKYKVFVNEYNPRRLPKSWYNPVPRYCYGSATLKKFPLNKLHRVLLVTNKDESSAIEPDFLSPDFLRPESGSSFETDSRIFQVVLSILCALSLKKKLDILSSNCDMMQNWTWGTTRFSTQTLIASVLYDDLKREFFLGDQDIIRCTKIFSLMKENLKYFCEPVIFATWYSLIRLYKHSYNRSFVSPTLSAKRKRVSALKEEYEKFLFSLVKDDYKSEDISRILENAKAAALSSSRLKVSTLQTQSIFLLE